MCICLKIGIRIDENAFIAWAERNRIEGIRPYSIGCKGVDSSTTSIEFYYIQTDHFFLQNIDLGSVPIYISFDPRFKKFLLGMDLLKLINYSVDNDKDEMTISLSAKYEEYKKTHLRTTIKSMYEMGIYSVKDADTDSMMMIE